MIHLRVQNQRVHLNVQDQQQHLGPGMNVNPLPVFSIGEVETLPAGSDAYATITGDPRTPELNLGIPEGDTYELTDEDKQDIAGIVEGDLNYVPAGSVGHLAWNATILNDSGEVYIDAQGNMGTLMSPVNRETLLHVQPGEFDMQMGRPNDTLYSVLKYGMTSETLEVRQRLKVYLYSGEYSEIGHNSLHFHRADDSTGGGIIAGLEDLDHVSEDHRATNKKYVDTGLSGKQDTIADLQTIRDGAALGASAVQTEADPVFTASVAATITSTDISTWNGKQPAGDYASAASGDSTKTALHTAGIPMGKCDITSSATAFTATVPGITSLYDGVCCYLTNGVITSASGFTVNINNLGALPVYSSQAAASRATTIFNVAYTGLFIYNSTRVEGGCWDYFYGYDSNTNTIGYQIRTNSRAMNMTDQMYRYRLMFTSADGTKLVPANKSTSTNATTARTPITTPIDPFGEILYYGYTTAISAGSSPSASYIFQQNTLTLGYSFTGISLTAKLPVYLVCAPQADGSAIIDATTPVTQTLPSTADGKIYIYLGTATSGTAFELVLHHPVYYYDNGIKLWTGVHTTETETISAAVAAALNAKTGTSDYSTSTTVSEALLALLSLI